MAFHGKFYFIGGRNGMGNEFSGASDGNDAWQPSADLLEIEGGFLVQMDLPGVDAASIEAIVDGQYLVVRGVRKAVYPTRSKRYIHMEVSRGEFCKTIALPDPVAEDNCRATLHNGVLEVLLPFGKRSVFAITTIRIQIAH